MTVSWAGYGLAKGDVDGRDSQAMTPGVLIRTESGLADPMTGRRIHPVFSFDQASDGPGWGENIPQKSFRSCDP